MTMIDELIEQLNTPDPSEKRNALEALYDYSCNDHVLEAAAYLLADTDRGVREAASRLLVLCSSDKAASLTAVHISSPNIAVRNLAGDALVRMRNAAISALLPYVDSADKDARKFAIDILAQLPATSAVVERIAAHLSDSDPNVVCAAIDALGALHAQQYLSEMLRLYDEGDYMRPNVVSAVARFPGMADLQFLVKALSDEDPVVQLAAAEALAARKDKDVLRILLQKIDSVSDLARPVVLHALVVLLESIDHQDEIPGYLKKYLIEMLDDVDPAYVRAAVRGLCYFPDEDVLLKLIGHIGKAESVDSAIFSVLKDRPEETLPLILKYTDGKTDVTAPTKMIISIVQHLVDKDQRLASPKTMEDISDLICRNFARLDDDTKITSLTVYNNLRGPGSIRLVKTALDDPELSVKSYAIDLAADIGPQFFVQQLEKLTEDYDEEIRYATTAILTKLKPSHAKARLSEGPFGDQNQD